MKKKIVCLFALAFLLLCVPARMDSVYAVGNEPVAEVGEETSTLDEAVAMFEDKILPIILGLGASGIAGILGIPFALRKIAKVRKEAASARTELNNVREYAAKLNGKFEALDAENGILKAQKEGAEGLANELVKKLADAQELSNTLHATSQLAQAETDRRIDVLSEEITALRRAASIAWQEADGAVQALVVAPSVNTLRRKDLELIKLKEEMRKLKGDEAEKLIADIAEAVANE